NAAVRHRHPEEFFGAERLLVELDRLSRALDDQVRRHRMIAIRNRFHSHGCPLNVVRRAVANCPRANCNGNGAAEQRETRLHRQGRELGVGEWVSGEIVFPPNCPSGQLKISWPTRETRRNSLLSNALRRAELPWLA